MDKPKYEYRWAIRFEHDHEDYRGRWYSESTRQRGTWEERKLFDDRTNAMAQLWKLRSTTSRKVRLVRIRRRLES